VRLDDVVVAAVDTDLFLPNPVMLAPISVDAYGNFTAGAAYVGAAGLDQVGFATYGTCSNWSTSSGTAIYGTANYIGKNAFDGFADTCTRGDAIYCLED